MNKSQVILFGALALILVIGGLIVNKDAFFQRLSPLSYVALVGENDSWYSAYRVDEGKKSSILPEFEGALVDYAQGGATEAVIVAENDMHVVYVRENGGEWVPVNTSPFEKRGIAVSPSGMYVAYAEQHSIEESADAIEAWSVDMFDVASGKLARIDVGYAPLFVVEEEVETLVFTSPSTIVSVDVGADEGFHSGVLPFAEGNIVEAVYLTQNGEYLIKRDLRIEEFTIYSVTERFPLRVDVIASVEGSSLIGVVENLVVVDGEEGIQAFDIATGAEVDAQFVEGVREITNK